MRIAFVSDIHGNLEALESVLKNIDGQATPIDKIFCLGDIVGYGPNPNECVELIKKRASVVIVGNHDYAALGKISISNFNAYAKESMYITRKMLSVESIKYLQDLPLTAQHNNITMVHSTPDEPEIWQYASTIEQVADLFPYLKTSMCFLGHTHIPYIAVKKNINSNPIFEKCDDVIKLNKTDSCIVNVGSVGQPRDKKIDACYAIHDSDKNSIDIIRVPYDIKKTQKTMKENKIPDYLIDRIAKGR